MILVKINQMVGSWIRSTAERLIAANAAKIVKIDCSPPTRSWCPTPEVPRSHHHVSCSAITLPDQPSNRQNSTRFFW
jgi:hypothetical protein